MSARLVVLVSGSGSNLQALLDAEDLGGEIRLVVSDRAGVRALARAEAAGIPTEVVAPGDHAGRAAWDVALEAAVAAADPDLVVLAGFMRILAPGFVRRWTVLNVHPSLLPAFPGAHAVQEALAWGVKISGCTVHLVDEEVDHGPIVAQGAVEVRDDDDAASLHARIQALEHRLLPRCVALFSRNRVAVDGRTVRILP